MAYNPTWKAAENGLPGNLEATNHAAQVDQFLAVHGITPIYQGNLIVAPGALTSTYGSPFFWVKNADGSSTLDTYDVDWPFVMPGGSTAIGHVQVAMAPVGNGADVQVTLYSDNGGAPNINNPLSSTVVPAASIVNLGASGGLPTAGALATQATNTLQTGPYTSAPWGTTSSSAAGLLTTTATASFGQYLLMFGGTDSSTGNSVPYVYTIQLSASGPAAAQPQPSLPQGLFGAGVAATADTVIVAGGYTGSAFSSAVYTASWDSNTGIISAWSAQASLPTGLDLAAVEVWNDSVVYVIGGNTSSGGSPTSTVSYASISNGQIQSWQTGPSLPSALFAAGSAIVGNTLIVMGGHTGPTSAGLTGVYWAKIGADGSLGTWRTGPSLPVGVGGIADSTFATDSGVFIMGGNTANGSPPTFTRTLQSLTITADGLGAWQQQLINGNAGNLATGGFSNGDGTYTMISMGLFSTGFSNTQTLYTVPLIPVPLPASGLTAGATYHLVFHQIGGDANNYVTLGEVECSSSSWLYATRYQYNPWAARGGLAILANIYDQTSGGPILHTWEDPTASDNPAKPSPAARTTTLVNDYRGRLLGCCEATMLPQDPLNSNPTFATGVTPWTVLNATFVQSTAQVRTGYPYSGLLTPSGGASFASIVSEKLPVTAGQWYTANSWFYSTTGYSQVALNINWFDGGQNPITSNYWQSALSAAAWSNINFNAQAPAGAAYANIVPAENGTPPSSALLYISDCALSPMDPTTLASVAAVTYPSGAVWPPTGVTQLN